MKKCLIASVVLMLSVSTVSYLHAAVYQFNGSVDNSFLTSGNWSTVTFAPPTATPGPGVPTVGDRAIIHDDNVVNYDTAVTTTVASLIVGADSPTTGELGRDGTLNMTAGKIIVSGGGDNFQIARARGAVVGDSDGDGLVTITNAELQIGGSDPVVGTRDHGVLDIGLNGKVYNTPGQDNYWRLGNYGPSVDAGLEGNGLLNVHSNGTFNAHVIFIGDNDATGEIRVSDSGSVVLTGNLVPRPSGFQAGGSAKVQMNGANATLSAYNLESESLIGEVPTLYEFNADSSLGISTITLTDAINITNNALVVNLNGYTQPNFDSLVLFDGDQALAGNRIFGTFASTTITGSPYSHRVVYDQMNGDILLQRVPEPTTCLLMGLGSVIALGMRRQTR